MRKVNGKRIVTMVLSSVLALSLLVGCGGQTPSNNDHKVAGTVLLSVNPEIEVEYDDAGLVVEIEGLNDDGKSVVAGLEGYIGKDCQTVVNELVKKIYEAGYFNETVDGHMKNIVVKLEDGSTAPDDDFLEKVADGARDAAKNCGIETNTMTVKEDDLDDEGRIGKEKAQELVLAQLGLTAASFNNHEYELDDGVYEFEFSVNGVEYEYEVDARTGKILKADIEGNDDWDDLDEWDDWEDFDIDDDDDDDKDDDKDDDRDDDDKDDDKDDDRDDDDDKDDDKDDDRDDDKDDDKDDDRDDDDDKDDDKDDDRDDDDKDDDKDDDRDDDDDKDDDKDDDRDDDKDDKPAKPAKNDKPVSNDDQDDDDDNDDDDDDD